MDQRWNFYFLDSELFKEGGLQSPISPCHKYDIVESKIFDAFNEILKLFKHNLDALLVLELIFCYSREIGAEICDIGIALRLH